MTPAQAHDQEQLQLLDVREPGEWADGHVSGALLMPMQQVPDRLGEIDRTRPVAVLCRSGNRSAAVAKYLTTAGFDAHNVEGGLQAWARAGLPLSR